MSKIGRPTSQPIEFNTTQEQVLFGTLMGDAYLKNPVSYASSIQFEHCRAQEAYALWKADILGMKTFYRERDDIRTGKVYHIIGAYSNCSPTYTDLYRRIYGQGGGTKHLDQTILYNLNALGLAVWYMDDGSLTVGREATIHTERYDYREHILMQNYFTERWGITPTIRKKRSQGGMKYILVFSVQDTRKFVEIVRPYMQPELMYKIAIRPYKRQPVWLKDIIIQEAVESNTTTTESEVS